MAANYTNITLAAPTTTQVANGACKLESITVNTKSTGAATAKVYDGLTASGTLIATIDTTNALGPNYTFNVQCKVGLTVVTTTATTAADLTVLWS